MSLTGELKTTLQCTCTLEPVTPPKPKKKFVLHEELERWDIAKDICAKDGMHLASIENQEEQDEVTALIQTIPAPPGYHPNLAAVYIGYNDLNVEDSFEWVDGSQSTYTNWDIGHPFNFENSDCVSMKKLNGAWEDQKCQTELAFVCSSD